MTDITSETPVRDIAVKYPMTIPVLESFGIDFCCGGKHTLATACAKKELNTESVLKELQLQERLDSTPATDWQQATLSDLTEYIVNKHHAFTRSQIILIRALLDKVESRHAAHHPEILNVSKTFSVVCAELDHHFHCEEQMLFPYIARMEKDKKTALPLAFGNVQQPIARMMADHDQAGDEFREMRELTNNYLPPDDACPTFRALYRALEDLEHDLHQHIHLENNILFPRALEQAAMTA